MRSKVLALTCIVSVCLLAQIGASALQDSQSTSTTQTTTASVKKTSSGEKSVAGCVAREGEGFVLKTDDGTYDFNTARDLSAYVGKKVRISGRWNSTGVTTTAPIKTTASAAAAEQPTADKTADKKAAPAKGFVGDLHLHISGEVIGDCEQPK